MALYDQVYAYIDGGLMAEAISINTALEGDNQPALTIVKGFAGITPSPKTRTISVESAVPSTGFEFDFEQAFLDSAEVEIVLQLGSNGKECTSRGYFTTVPVSAGVGQAATISFEFTGTPEAFA